MKRADSWVWSDWYRRWRRADSCVGLVEVSVGAAFLAEEAGEAGIPPGYSILQATLFGTETVSSNVEAKLRYGSKGIRGLRCSRKAGYEVASNNF